MCKILDTNVDSGYTFLVPFFFFFSSAGSSFSNQVWKCLNRYVKREHRKEGQRVVKEKSWYWTEMGQMLKGQHGSILI